MPIKDRSKYPANWAAISAQVRLKADNKCELCGAANGHPAPISGKRVVLTVHHITHNPADNRPVNLIALCQRCHLRLDAPWRVKK